MSLALALVETNTKMAGYEAVNVSRLGYDWKKGAASLDLTEQKWQSLNRCP